ncbi:hypothetical protein Runsl_3466 [Runella slithyformis DSM 19594]|uniref:Uncharacterized protein n=2 Tax=Runella TaxID=105 RepID=A0A7U3ZMA2_RUNSL|nr:hypothetical protein Runsl_3466 [Runella slithyformis DSM 19594]
MTQALPEWPDFLRRIFNEKHTFMKQLSTFFYRISNRKILVGLIALYLVFPGYFLKNAETQINTLSGKVLAPIDLTMGFTPDRTLQMVEQYGPAARDYYATVEMTIDVIYPLVYTCLFAVILSLLYYRKSYRPFALVNVFPLVTLLFDYLENITIVTLLKSYPDMSMTVATFCEIFKMLKWFTFAVTALLVIYGLLKSLKMPKELKQKAAR